MLQILRSSCETSLLWLSEPIPRLQGVGRHKTWATHPEHNRRIALPGIALPLGCRVSAAGSLGGACRRRALAGCARCQCCTRAARVICSGQALLRVRPWTSRGMPMVPSAVFCAKAGRPH